MFDTPFDTQEDRYRELQAAEAETGAGEYAPAPPQMDGEEQAPRSRRRWIAIAVILAVVALSPRSRFREPATVRNGARSAFRSSRW